MSNYPGPEYQGPWQPHEQSQQPFQPQAQPYQEPQYHQPQSPQPYQEPVYHQPPYQQPPQPQGSYVPMMYVAKVPGPGVGGLILGILALVFTVMAFSAGVLWVIMAWVLAIIGTPIAIVALVRRIRAKLTFTVGIVAVAANSVVIALLFWFVAYAAKHMP